MGGLVKMFEKDIIERRLENGACVVNEYQPMRGNNWPVASDDSETWQLSPEQVMLTRQFFERVNKECEERMAREKVIVYKFVKLNERQTALTLLEHMTKAEAVELRAGVTGGQLLDLDAVYMGILLSDGYLFISENAMVRGLRKYGSDVALITLIEGLFEEKGAAYEAAYQRAA